MFGMYQIKLKTDYSTSFFSRSLLTFTLQITMLFILLLFLGRQKDILSFPRFAVLLFSHSSEYGYPNC